MPGNLPEAARPEPDGASRVDAAAIATARALLLELSAVGRHFEHPEERLAMLAALEPRIDGVLRELEAVFKGLPQPLEPAARTALNLYRRVCHGAADAWDVAARAVLSSPPAPARPRVAPLLFKALRHLARAMRASYRMYARLPAGTWKKAHGLYLLAEELGIASGIADAQSRSSIAGLYCESLLLSVVDPYRLEAGEEERIEAVLASLRPTLSLAREAPETPSSCHFLVSGAQDAPPGPLGSGVAESAGDVRVFDTSSVVDALRRREGATPQEACLAAKLISLWEGPPRRVFRREPAQGSVAICVGLKPIAHFVAHDATADGEAEARALREGITIPLRALPEDEGGQLIPIHEWAVINMSAGGLRLRRRAPTAYPIVVGEVVGIRAPGKALWMVGVTRWIAAEEDGATEFGVQFFAEAACAIWIRGLDAASTRKLGLLVSESAQADAESLLAPPGTYGGGPYDVRGEGFRTRMRAVALVEANSRFELFRVVAD